MNLHLIRRGAARGQALLDGGGVVLARELLVQLILLRFDLFDGERRHRNWRGRIHRGLRGRNRRGGAVREFHFVGVHDRPQILRRIGRVRPPEGHVQRRTAARAEFRRNAQSFPEIRDAFGIALGRRHLEGSEVVQFLRRAFEDGTRTEDADLNVRVGGRRGSVHLNPGRRFKFTRQLGVVVRRASEPEDEADQRTDSRPPQPRVGSWSLRSRRNHDGHGLRRRRCRGRFGDRSRGICRRQDGKLGRGRREVQARRVRLLRWLRRRRRRGRRGDERKGREGVRGKSHGLSSRCRSRSRILIFHAGRWKPRRIAPCGCEKHADSADRADRVISVGQVRLQNPGARTS